MWSNFPMYVFEDEAFRRYYRRVPAVIDSKRVLGFLLHESDQEELPRGGEIRFVDDISVKDFRAKEWEEPSTHKPDAPSTRGATLGAALLLPFSWLGQVIAWNAGVERGRWPTPSSPLARRLVQSIDGLLAGVYPLLFGVLAFAVVAIGAWTVLTSFATEQLSVLPATDWTDPRSYATRPLVFRVRSSAAKSRAGRPDRKARRPSISGICEGGATQRGGMPRPGIWWRTSDSGH